MQVLRVASSLVLARISTSPSSPSLDGSHAQIKSKRRLRVHSSPQRPKSSRCVDQIDRVPPTVAFVGLEHACGIAVVLPQRHLQQRLHEVLLVRFEKHMRWPKRCSPKHSEPKTWCWWHCGRARRSWFVLLLLVSADSIIAAGDHWLGQATARSCNSPH